MNGRQPSQPAAKTVVANAISPNCFTADLHGCLLAVSAVRRIMHDPDRGPGHVSPTNRISKGLGSNDEALSERQNACSSMARIKLYQCCSGWRVTALAAWPAKTPRKLVPKAALVMALGTLTVARQAPWSKRRGPPFRTCLRACVHESFWGSWEGESRLSHRPMPCWPSSCFFLPLNPNTSIVCVSQKPGLTRQEHCHVSA